MAIYINFVTDPYQPVEKAIPGVFNSRLAKDASANLTNFLALSEPAKFGTTSLCRFSPFFNGLLCRSGFSDGHVIFLQRLREQMQDSKRRKNR